NACRLLAVMMVLLAAFIRTPSAESPAWKVARTESLTGVKVAVSEPVLVTRSRGYLWFPTLIPLANGDLLAVMSNYADTHVKEAASLISWSSDRGLTWSMPREARAGGDPHMRLANGDALLLPYYLFPQGDGVIGAPCQICPRGKQELTVKKEGVTVAGW